MLPFACTAQNACRSLLLLTGCLIVFLLSACGVDFIGAPPFEELTIEDGYQAITAPDGRTWQVIFELPGESTFEGVVRHVSRWQDDKVPFMSHDILVTRDDFANPDRVRTWVFDHKFFYRYDQQRPNRQIHLLHVFPASEEIYHQLQQIGKWDTVRIRGREIFKINLYDAQGNTIGFFTDMGCNTILVTEIEMIPEAAGIP